MGVEEVLVVLFLITFGAVMGSGLTVWVQGLLARRNRATSEALGEQLVDRLEGRFEDVLSRTVRRLEALEERVEFSEELLASRRSENAGGRAHGSSPADRNPAAVRETGR